MKPTLNLLASYWYYKTWDFTPWLAQLRGPNDDLTVEVMADSGAFSAHKLGGAVDVGEYADWLHRNARHFRWYINLDVKGDVAAGLRNQAYLEGRGLHPLPVYHGGEPWSVLEEMVAAYPYIALGNMAGTMVPVKEMVRWIHRVFEIGGDKAVFHGLGQTAWAMLKAVPWYSVDSSSYIQGVRYGTLPLFDSVTGRWVKLSMHKPSEWVSATALVRAHGYTTADFLDPARYHYRNAVGIGALTYERAAAWLRRLHGERPHPTDPTAPPGFRLYLAETNKGHVLQAAYAIRRYHGLHTDGPPDPDTGVDCRMAAIGQSRRGSPGRATRGRVGARPAPGS